MKRRRGHGDRNASSLALPPVKRARIVVAAPSPTVALLDTLDIWRLLRDQYLGDLEVALVARTCKRLLLSVEKECVWRYLFRPKCLQLASQQGYLEIVEWFYAPNEDQIFEDTDVYNALLIDACRKGLWKRVRFLHSSRVANIDIMGALAEVIEHGHDKLFVYLLNKSRYAGEYNLRMNEIALLVAKYGRLDYYHSIIERNTIFVKDAIYTKACESGNLAFVQHMEWELGDCRKPKGVDLFGAAMNGHAHIIQHILRRLVRTFPNINMPRRYKMKILKNLLKSGKTEAVREIWPTLIDETVFRTNPATGRFAVRSGSTALCEYLLANNCLFDSDCYEIASQFGHAHILDFLAAHEIPRGALDMEKGLLHAIRNDSVPCAMFFFIQSGRPVQPVHLDRAIVYNACRVFQYFLSTFSNTRPVGWMSGHWMRRMMKRAFSKGHLGIVDMIRRRRGLAFGTSFWSMATTPVQLYYLTVHDCPRPSPDITKDKERGLKAFFTFPIEKHKNTRDY